MDIIISKNLKTRFKKSNLPVLSVIIPCYNSEHFIGKTIQSVLNQSFIDWELIIVNDGSTDASEIEISKFQKNNPRIKLFTIENGGVNKARNFGYSKISNDSVYIHFLDSDDIILPEFYLRLISFLDSNNDYGAVFSNHRFINQDSEEISSPAWGSRLVPTRYWMAILPENQINTPYISVALWCKMVESMVIIRRSKFESSKKWDESFGYGKIGEGVVLYCELALYSRIGYIQEELFLYRRHVKQSSQNNSFQFNSFRITSEKILDILPTNKQKRHFKAVLHRNSAYNLMHRIKYTIRYKPWKMPFIVTRLVVDYLRSSYLIFWIER